MAEETFDEYISRWDDTCARIEVLNRQLKPLKETEMIMRKAIRDSVKTAMGDDWKEGVNSFPISGRTLKITQKLAREIDPAQIANTREEYEKLNSATQTFDELLRLKYELEIRAYRKLDDAAVRVLSRMITTKESAPDIEIK